MKLIKLSFIIFSFLSIFGTAFAQEKINQVDAQGKKEGLWKGVYEASKRPRYEGTFEKGYEVGVFNYFDDTKAQTVIAKREFSEKGTVAKTTFFDQKGNIVSEGVTVNKLKEGVWNYYHKGSKQLMNVENYKNGKLEGLRTVYFNSGNIAEEANYVDGKREGVYKVYLENGIVVEEATFKNGLYDGVAIFRDIKGNIVSKGPFVKGLKKGMWEFYEGEKLIKKEKYPLRVKFEKKTNIPKM